MKILLAGASGTIGSALGQRLASQGHQLVSVSRNTQPDWSLAHIQTHCTLPSSVAEIRDQLTALKIKPQVVIQCAGVLHDQDDQPEKALLQLNEDWLMHSMQINLMSHIYVAQAVHHLLDRKHAIKWVSISAMVGSIQDNELGGWYSYRMSKAALNMFVKNLSIEWRRKSPDSIAVALHPGTTESALSYPFQANIAEGKLYSKEQTAERLAQVIENLSSQQNGHLLHWDGETIPF